MVAKGLLLSLLFLFCMTLRVVHSMTTASSTSGRLVFHWFRNGDLRIHDNPALVHSAAKGDVVVPIYCFDDQQFFGEESSTPIGSLKCGVKRAKFIRESVHDLREQLQSVDSNLAVSQGNPAAVFDQILSKLKDSAMNVTISCQEEVLKEENDTVQAVNEVLKRHRPGSILEEVWGSTMYDLEDLPYDDGLQDMPDTFTPFRNKVEKKSSIRKPLPAPEGLKLPTPDSVEYKSVAEFLSNSIPTLGGLGYADTQIHFAETYDERAVMNFKGGETAALARVKDYIWDKDLLKVYFETRNGMLGADYSTKFSPWLAHGCLSPRQIVKECQKYEEQRVANKSTYWVVFELLWRDFCKFFCVKHGDRIFFPAGTTARKDKTWSTFEKNFEAWKEGKTGYPLVDANMREMKATGFMSNRGRQNVASFLAIDLSHDWRMGGDWFESNLIDYDVYSNWVNWCAAAGMTGGRLNRFNIVKQSKDYDQHGDYVRHWLPELKNLPTEFVHEPWKMSQANQAEYGVRLGVDYPKPIIQPFQPKHQRGGKSNHKQRKPNKHNNKGNRHQKYEMKSLKEGGYQMLDR